MYFHLHQSCRNEIVLREKCGDNFNDARISSAINSSKIGASAVVVKTTVAKENEPRSRSFCAKSFNGVLIVQPPLHIDRGTHGIVDHRPSNSLVKRFLCIPSTSRCFPLTSILSPIPLSGNNRETGSILWLKHQDLFNDPSPVQLSPSNYSLLRLESRS